MFENMLNINIGQEYIELKILPLGPALQLAHRLSILCFVPGLGRNQDNNETQTQKKTNLDNP